MASTEGAPIPRVYGRARLAGQVIWATQLEEVVSDHDRDAAGGKGGVAAATTHDDHDATAISPISRSACAKGRSARVARVWADGKPLDLAGVTMRVYRGDEDQTPDPLIVAKEARQRAGLSRPRLRRVRAAAAGRISATAFRNCRSRWCGRSARLETDGARGHADPGATEFGYEPQTVVQLLGPGQSAPENRHVALRARPTSRPSLDELQALCPNLERVAVVVAWFGNDLRAGQCAIKPGVEIATKTDLSGGLVGRRRRPRRRASGLDHRRPAGLWRHAVGRERRRT